jgi:hypothetical protein
MMNATTVSQNGKYYSSAETLRLARRSITARTSYRQAADQGRYDHENTWAIRPCADHIIPHMLAFI